MHKNKPDSHISRIDLIGKDAIILKDNKQITEFKMEYFRGLQKPCCLFLMNTMQEDLMLCLLYKEF